MAILVAKILIVDTRNRKNAVIRTNASIAQSAAVIRIAPGVVTVAKQPLVVNAIRTSREKFVIHLTTVMAQARFVAQNVSANQR